MNVWAVGLVGVGYGALFIVEVGVIFVVGVLGKNCGVL